MPPLDRRSFLTDYGERLNVSRETFERLSLYVDLLNRWNQTHNLVGAATMVDPWRRHILDSAQIAPRLNALSGGEGNGLTKGGNLTLADLGSGAGLPGLVLAIITGAATHLIESNQKKCAFLDQAARSTGAAVTVHCRRIEDSKDIRADVVTARALAPLPALLGYARNVGGPAARLIALKGRGWRDELAAARKEWALTVSDGVSLSDPAGRVLELIDFQATGGRL